MSLHSAGNMVAAYSLLVGLMMIGMWLSLFLKKQVPELREKPKAISFHLIAEVSTAVLLIVSGIGLFLSSEWTWMLSPISLGMLLYSIINSPGKYADENNLPMVTVFLVLIILTVIAIVALFILV
ncbi:MAG: hypothetical protein OEY24_03120 [Candidatus Bathyarchaeota archaeon]|nr:hypothetical protein [Candidatus Bathyarchaeota archaeon]MDH5494678.1 hypothetical protein [Candidatus Bathyarchaeota archaeon]